MSDNCFVTWAMYRRSCVEEGQTVKGIIIALTDHQRLRRALTLLKSTVDFYRYEVNFDLIKSKSVSLHSSALAIRIWASYDLLPTFFRATSIPKPW